MTLAQVSGYSIFNVPFGYADSVQLADVKDTFQEFATSLELSSNVIENLESRLVWSSCQCQLEVGAERCRNSYPHRQHCEETKS